MSNGHRNPLVKVSRSRIVNNIVYNWQHYATGIAGGVQVDIVGNLYRRGPDSTDGQRHEIAWGLTNHPDCPEHPTCGPLGDPSIHIRGNVGPHQSNPDGDNWVMIEQCDVWESGGTRPDRALERATPLPDLPFPITVYPVSEIEDAILRDVGASSRLDSDGLWVPNRDTVDKRLIQEYRDGAGQIPLDENAVGGLPVILPGVVYLDSDHDGMPDAWEERYGLEPDDPSDGVDDGDIDGYTNVEEYLNGTDPTKGRPIVRRFLPLSMRSCCVPD